MIDYVAWFYDYESQSELLIWEFQEIVPWYSFISCIHHGLLWMAHSSWGFQLGIPSPRVSESSTGFYAYIEQRKKIERGRQAYMSFHLFSIGKNPVALENVGEGGNEVCLWVQKEKEMRPEHTALTSPCPCGKNWIMACHLYLKYTYFMPLGLPEISLI